MVTIQENKHAVDKKEFVVLNENVNGKSDYIQMDIRLSDFESEGKALFFSVFDSSMEKEGNHSPLEIEKNELKELINYLTEAHNQL